MIVPSFILEIPKHIDTFTFRAAYFAICALSPVNDTTASPSSTALQAAQISGAESVIIVRMDY